VISTLNVIDRDRVHSREWFVEKHELGLRDQRPGDLEPPPLTAGEGVGLLIAQVGEAELVQQLLQSALRLIGREVERLQDGHHIVADREPAKNGGFLREISDPVPCSSVHRDRGDVALVEEDPAFIGGEEAHDHVEGRRLPRSVRAQQADDLSLLETKVDVVHDPAALERLDETLGSQDAGPGDTLGGS
jgi:ATP-binding cassette subfamily B protein